MRKRTINTDANNKYVLEPKNFFEGTQYILHVGKRLNSTDPFHITLEFLLYASVPVCIEYSLYSSFLEIFEKELQVSILLKVEVAKYFFQKCKLFLTKMKNIFFSMDLFIMHTPRRYEFILQPSNLYVFGAYTPAFQQQLF